MATVTNKKASKAGKAGKAGKAAPSRAVAHRASRPEPARAKIAAARKASGAIPPANPLRVAAKETWHADNPAQTLRLGQASLVVNGTSRGTQDVKGMKLGDFVIHTAQQYGLKNFSVYVDGNKLGPEAGTAMMDDAANPVGKVEMVAKDARAEG